MPNINLSVVKRSTESIGPVSQSLEEQGFEDTGQLMDGRVRYFENPNGINLTVADGPFATLVFPSGPIRGSIFGNDAVGIGGGIIAGGEGGSEDSSDNGSEPSNKSTNTDINV